ncbi:hypothetical protein AT01_2541 [Yersinia aldovae 670-83]|nr:hypothetical protein AT01_2541 [Yersinia aldovae 670-83]
MGLNSVEATELKWPLSVYQPKQDPIVSNDELISTKTRSNSVPLPPVILLHISTKS